MNSLPAILQSLGPTAARLERLRLRSVILYLFSVTLTLVGLAVGIYFTGMVHNDGTWQNFAYYGLIYTSPLLAVFAHFACFQLFFESYQRAFRQSLVPGLITGINPHLKLTPRNFISQNTFDNGYIQNIATIVSGFRGKNLVTGAMGKIPVQFCELRIHFKSSRDKVSAPVPFLFFQAKLPQAFPSHTYISHGSVGGSLGKVLAHSEKDLAASNKAMELDLSMVNFSDKELEKEFIVLGNNHDQTRKLLSGALLGRLRQIKRSYHRCFSVFCTGNDLYVTIITSYDLFKPPFFRPATAVPVLVSHLQEYYLDVAMFLEIGKLLSEHLKGEANSRNGAQQAS